ncbi:MAG: ABC transporter substrate-binding protein [Alphaproteobacteria bacterium]|nr:ABC transporter substrate-binding protein [Alphaproteobacteria bacterium]
MKKLLIATAAGAALLASSPAAPVWAQSKATTLIWGDQLPAGLDPHAIFDVPMQYVLLNVYDGVYRYIGNPPELKPWLAQSHSVSADGLTWELKLRPGIKFHDGSEMTADDVVYSFQRVLNLKRGPAGAFLPVLKPDKITAPDKLTVRFQLDRAYAPFLSAIPLVAIVNPRAIKPNEKDGDWGMAWLANNGAGSGSYSIEAATYRPREALNLHRFKDHFMGWGHNARPIDLVQSRPVLETSTRVLALMRGDIDSTDSYLPTDQVERVQKNASTVVAKDESMRVFIIRMNNKKSPFDNVDFRRCVSQAFNYDGFINVILKGYAERNPGPNPKNLWGSPKDLKGYDFDLAKAKASCEKAKATGAPIEREFEIHTQSELDQTLQAAQLLQSDLKKIGLNARIVPNQWPNLTSSTAKPETTPDMWIHWISTYFVDPENWIGQTYDSQFHGTWKASSWYSNAAVDNMLREARASSDQAKRQQLYEQASRIVVDEAADIWVYNTVQLRGLTKRVEGYAFSPVGSGGDLRYLSLKN